MPLYEAWARDDKGIAILLGVLILIGMAIVNVEHHKKDIPLFIAPRRDELLKYVGTDRVRWCGDDDNGIHPLHRWADFIVDPMDGARHTVHWVCLGHECDDPTMHI